MTGFWRSWLTVWCIGTALFGLLLYGAGFAATDGLARATFAAFSNPLPPEPDRYLRFSISLMGAVTVGWALTLFTAIRMVGASSDERTASHWRWLTATMIVWYVIDSLASVANGFPLNAVSNTVLIVLFLIPVAATKALSASRRSE